MPDRASLRVLHVDDDPAFLDLTAVSLAGDGIEVASESDANAVLDRLAAGADVGSSTTTAAGTPRGDPAFDCVVSDFDMPGMDGLSLLEAVRESYPDLPFVLFTGKGSEEIAAEAISAGVTDYIQKRSGTEQFRLLANRIRNAVAQARAERRLERSEERYRRLVDTSPTPIGIYTASGEIVYANRAGADFFDADDPAALCGRNVFDLVEPSDRGLAEERVRQVIEDREPAPPVELELTSFSGERRHAVLTSAPVEYDGDPAAQVVINDITEYVRTHDELARRNEQLDRFTGVVSHDLRNPLNVLSGRLAAARERASEVTGPTAEALQQDLVRMTEAAESMDALVSDLLTLARQGETVDSPEPVWLPTVARSAWSNVQTGESAELTVDANRSVPGDEHRLQELLQNLYANAVQHGGADVTVRVVALPDAEGFAVADDGRGFADAEPSAVFDHGYTTDSDGTGFGLAIVERIVDAHGWSIRATESAAGGARFEIRTGTE